MTVIRNINIQASDSFSIDAFGRWRCSNPITLFDSKNIFNDPDLASSVENLPLFYDNQQTAGAGTSTEYRANEASQRISVDATTAGTRVRQTRKRFNYQSGKSQLILTTFDLHGAVAGNTKRIGYFDENNGLFLQTVGTAVSFVRRTNATGSPVNNSVAQASWNIDPMNGSGPSGITLDFDKTQILFIDFEWLGVGRVRMGFVVNGLIYYAHQFLNTNNLEVVYMSTPNLPLRAEITNDGTGVADFIDCICSTVISEGGSGDLGAVRYASTPTAVACSATNTNYAILGIQLRSAYIGDVIKILEARFIETAGSKEVEWTLKFNPTVAGSFTYTGLAQSSVAIASGATANTVTGGYDIGGGFLNSLSGLSTGITTAQINSAIVLGSTIAGVSDSIVLCAKMINADINGNIFGSLTWRETV